MIFKKQMIEDMLISSTNLALIFRFFFQIHIFEACRLKKKGESVFSIVR